MFAQQKQISTLKNTSFPQIMANPYLPIEEFDFESEKIFQHQFTLKEITDKIHDQLTQRFYFTFPYSGQIHVKVERPYCQKISFKGVEYIRRTINHNAKVPYKGYVNYKRNQDYNGSVQAHTCYFTCRWCNDSIYNKSFSGTEYFSGNVQYYGTKYYQETRPVMKQIVYDEEVPCAGTIEHSQWVQYNGEGKACCQKGNSLGQGHHDCTSCKTWDKFVNAFKKLIEIKAKIIGNVQKNMKTLTNLAKPPREIIQA